MFWLRNKKIIFLLGTKGLSRLPQIQNQVCLIDCTIFLHVSLGGGLLPNSGTVMGTVDWVCILISSWKSRSESGANLTA